MPTPGQPKVIVVPLAVNQVLATDGTTSFSYVEVEAPQAARLGTQIESMRVLTITRGRTANHSWKVLFQASHDGKSWFPTTPVDLTTAMTADDQLIHTEYTDGDDFTALHLRFMLGAANSTGSTVEMATVSAWLVVTLKS